MSSHNPRLLTYLVGLLDEYFGEIADLHWPKSGVLMHEHIRLTAPSEKIRLVAYHYPPLYTVMPH